ncbi:endoplasmic reticulum resident protein 29 [Anopheles nili]|uniref:endoplasmic reticulum resident protein 29 n=1 Tax=Anopheles nili TaxID=185578 RepID=UPI00237C38D8|nr:endoplasmic reticulum resident protein 29 [Anopheles nili]
MWYKPFAIIIVLLISTIEAWTARGCVDLDSSTFDKVVGKFRYSLVKFDTAFPYGDKHEAFTNLALETVEASDELLFALVGIKDYGEKDNNDLGKRFNIGKEYPVIKLFAGARSKPIDFPPGEEITAENLRKFLKRTTSGLYIGLPGCVQKLDELAQAFMKTVEPSERQSIIAEVEQAERDTPEEDPSKKSHAMYLSVMRKIVKSGDRPESVVSNEMKRVAKLLAGKLSDAKRAELKLRSNIMLSFSTSGDAAKSKRTEL